MAPKVRMISGRFAWLLSLILSNLIRFSKINAKSALQILLGTNDEAQILQSRL